MKLVSVIGDPNTDGGGSLNASNNTGKVFVNGLKVVYLNSTAQPDSLCIVFGGDHCQPFASSASSKVFGEGIAIHRNDDMRACGASTIVIGNTKVYAG